MQAFKDYIVSAYKKHDGKCVCSDFKFSHKVKVKRDKKTEVMLRIDCINLTVRFFDKDMELLYSAMFSFANNVFKMTSDKILNLKGDDLTIRFETAKGEICKVIIDEYVGKRNEINAKIKDVGVYLGKANNIIPPEFQGEQIKPVDGGIIQPMIMPDEPKKKDFDM